MERLRLKQPTIHNFEFWDCAPETGFASNLKKINPILVLGSIQLCLLTVLLGTILTGHCNSEELIYTGHKGKKAIRIGSGFVYFLL